MNKELFNRMLFSMLFFTGLPQIAKYFRRNGCMILIYHGVMDKSQKSFIPNNFVALSNFEKQIRYIKNNYSIITLSEAVKIIADGNKFMGNPIVITFDDGYENVFSTAFPVLKKHMVPFSVFLSTDYLDSNLFPWWDKLQLIYELSPGIIDRNMEFYKTAKKLMPMPIPQQDKYLSRLEDSLKVKVPEARNHSFMSWNNVKVLVKSGLAEIGSHSCSHPLMSALDDNHLYNEITDSKEIIEKKLNVKVDAFAYPFGFKSSYSPEVKKALKKAGYRCGLSGLPGINGKNADLFELKRISVYTDAPWYALISQISGIFELFWELRNVAVRFTHLFRRLFIRNIKRNS